MRVVMKVPTEAPARVPNPVPVPDDPDVFDLIGFISLLLVEHGRDLGLTGQQLEEIHGDILTLLGFDTLTPKLAARLVAELRRRRP